MVVRGRSRLMRVTMDRGLELVGVLVRIVVIVDQRDMREDSGLAERRGQGRRHETRDDTAQGHDRILARVHGRGQESRARQGATS